MAMKKVGREYSKYFEIFRIPNFYEKIIQSRCLKGEVKIDEYSNIYPDINALEISLSLSWGKKAFQDSNYLEHAIFSSILAEAIPGQNKFNEFNFLVDYRSLSSKIPTPVENRLTFDLSTPFAEVFKRDEKGKFQFYWGQRIFGILTSKDMEVMTQNKIIDLLSTICSQKATVGEDRLGIDSVKYFEFLENYRNSDFIQYRKKVADT
jgi:hypothetical protein